MSDKRMLRGSLIREEKFRALPAATQMLYVNMAMDADDDGFITSAREYCKRRGYSPKRLENKRLAKILGPLCVRCGYAVCTLWARCGYAVRVGSIMAR